jgi:predicted alpha/beta-hydrolase family hydrolase
MTMDQVTIPVDAGRSVSGLLLMPERARACYVLAHGAGAGMTHSFLAAVSTGLAERDVATLRFQFPYMDRIGRRSPVPPFAQRSTPRFGWRRDCRCSRGASRLAAA